MKSADHQFLAGARLARYEDGSELRRHAANASERLPDGGASPRHTFELRRVPDAAVIRCQCCQRWASMVWRCARERAIRVGLVQIVGRAFADRFDGRFRGVMSRHEDHVYGGIESHDAIEHFESADVGHDEVSEEGVFAEDDLKTVSGIMAANISRPLLRESGGQEFQAAGVVINNDKLYRRFRSHSVIDRLICRGNRRVRFRRIEWEGGRGGSEALPPF